MATIIAFPTVVPAAPARGTVPEIIVFPRTDVRALRRLSAPQAAPPAARRDPSGEDAAS